MPRRSSIFKMMILLFLLMCSGMRMPLFAQQDTGHIQNVEAVFIYHFTKYIQWMDEDSLEFTIGLIGDTQVLEPLTEIAQRQHVRRKEIRVCPIANMDEIESCQVVFVSRSGEEQLNGIISRSQNRNILIVSEIEGALESGVMINFLLLQETVKFEINLRAMKQAGFQPSSELLKLAVRVIE